MHLNTPFGETPDRWSSVSRDSKIIFFYLVFQIGPVAIMTLIVGRRGVLLTSLGALLLATTTIAILRIRDGWRWPGPTALGVVVAVVMAPAWAFMLYAFSNIPEDEGRWAAVFTLIGMGVHVFGFVLGLMPGSKKDYLAQCRKLREEGETPGDRAEGEREAKAHGGRRSWPFALAGLFWACGLFGWFGGGACAVGWWQPEPSTELPLGVPVTLVVDGAGRTYCGSLMYGRVQAYDGQGRFLWGWQVDAGAGTFRLGLGEAGEILVATARNDMFYKLDPQGQLLEAQGDAGEMFGRLDREEHRWRRDAEGNRYDIRSGILWPRIVKTDAEGNDETLVGPRFPLWLVAAPMPSLLWMAVGTLLAVIGWHRTGGP